MMEDCKYSRNFHKVDKVTVFVVFEYDGTLFRNLKRKLSLLSYVKVSI